MARLRTWQSNLAALFAERRRAPFRWGVHDCCLWPADGVLAVTGVDPAADLRDTYATEAEAEAVLAAHGGLVEIAIARLGPVIPTDLAQPGDVGLLIVPAGERPSLALYGGGGLWWVPGPRGLVEVFPDKIARAWRCSK